jgi:hypothetical protein
MTWKNFETQTKTMLRHIKKGMKTPGDGREFHKHASDKSLIVMLEHSPGMSLDWLPYLINVGQWAQTAALSYEARGPQVGVDKLSRDEQDDFLLDVIDEALELVKQPIVKP